jgi:hypothetical protein
MCQLAQQIAAQAAARPDPDGLEPWQRAYVGELVSAFMPLATALPRTPPRTALLITFTSTSTGETVMTVDVDLVVQWARQRQTTRPPRRQRPPPDRTAGYEWWRSDESPVA